MNVAAPFVRRPIATSLLMAAIAMFGIVAYRALPVSDLPTVDFPTIQVQAGLPGGDGRQILRSIRDQFCNHLVHTVPAQRLHNGAKSAHSGQDQRSGSIRGVDRINV